jgi:DNA repair protein RadA/Sms
MNLATDGKKVLYISGEESGHQVKQRAERLGVSINNIRFSNEISVESIIRSLMNDSECQIVIIDSIQTVYSAGIPSPVGSVSQIKESASQLVDFAKQHNKILIIVGHVTKDGDIAGPKTLEHLVDCVLYLEGERQSQFRVLRAKKNRFGPTDEVGLFEMLESGLRAVDNPTIFLENAHIHAPGSSSIAIVEGSRTLFFEIQSLVVKTSLSIPRRVVSGIDYNRLQLLLAVMRKYMNVRFDEYDVYVNVVGGVSAKSTAADLGVIMSIFSSLTNKVLPKKAVSIGEVGLLGEIRRVNGQEKALKEARRLKFSHIYSSENITNVQSVKKIFG